MPHDMPIIPEVYQYIKLVKPILRTDLLTPSQKLVWGVIYHYELRHWKDLSQRKIQAEIGVSIPTIRTALTKLEDLGAITREKRIDPNRGTVVSYRTTLTKEIAASAKPWDLLRVGAVEISEDDDQDDDDPTAGGRSGGEGGERNYHRGGERNYHRGVKETFTLQLGRNNKEEIIRKQRPDSGESERPPRIEELTPSIDEGNTGGEEEEIEETNPDCGSDRALTSSRVSSSKPSQVRNPSRARRPDGDPALRKCPSKRLEFQEWRSKTSRFVGRDLVGYWVVRYREVRGVEDPAFFFDHLDSLEVVRAMGNARDYFRKWCDRSFKKWQAAVDLVLEKAEAAGKPVKFAYFFTPSNGSTLEGLKTSVDRGQRMTSLSYLEDDKSGAFPEKWAQAERESIRGQ